MISRRGLSALVVPTIVVVAMATGAWWGTRAGHSRDAPRLPVTPAARLSALTDEAIRLYATGQFPRACERFSRAWDDEPASTARREDVARCFEAWGWSTLRQGRPDEAMLLFRQGLRQSPETPALLRGLGLAAVHAGRTDEALAPLEAAAGAGTDAEVRLLLAHLYDRGDDTARALAHLRTVLDVDPAHDAARRLLDKVEREARAEAGFRREVTTSFLVKWHAGGDLDTRRALVTGLTNARARVVAQLGEAPRERVTVILYEAAQFQEVVRVHGWVTGLFDGKIRLPAGPPCRRNGSSSASSFTSTPTPPSTIWRVDGRRAGSTRGWLRRWKAPRLIRCCGCRADPRCSVSRSSWPTLTPGRLAPAMRSRCGWSTISSTGAGCRPCASS